MGSLVVQCVFFVPALEIDRGKPEIDHALSTFNVVGEIRFLYNPTLNEVTVERKI